MRRDTGSPLLSPMKETTVSIGPEGASRILAGHLWVYRSDVRDSGGAEGGEVVCVATAKGRFLARAFYSSRSQIALRVICREDVPVNREFWRQRICASDAWRQQLFPAQNTYRVVFSDSDLCSSIILDRYEDFLSLQTLSQGSERLRPLLVDLLVEHFQPRAIVVRNDGKVRDLEGLPQEKYVGYGHLPGNPQISMGGMLWEVDLLNGQKTGLFLDQRENYLAARQYARGMVLDAFSYAGGFGIHCASVADQVETLEIAEAAVGQIRRNAELNQTVNVSAIQGNCFDLLRQFYGTGRKFDLVILDPPAFAKSRSAIGQAKKGYKEINLRAMKILNPGGHLVTCSCSYHISPFMFEKLLQESAADAHREAQVMEIRGQARDHPALLSMPETHYLKCWVLRVL